MSDRLFVTDLDGTLLNSCASLSDNTVCLLDRFIRAGVPVTYATSRSFYTASVLLERVPFRLPCITYNGAYVVMADSGEILRKNLLDRELFGDILSVAGSMGLRPFVFGKTPAGEEKLLYDEPDNPAQADFIDTRLSRNDRRLQRQTGDTYDLCELITLNFIYPPESIRPLAARLAETLGGRISVKVTRDIYNEGYLSLETSHPDANKGSMLRYLCELLNIDRGAVTVFGDQANDLDMFESAGVRVAVANASDELKAAADAVTGSNDDDGVVKYILSQLA